MKRSFLLATLIAATITLHAAEPKRGGGLFGFGAPEGEQISAGLFPSANSPTPASEGGASTATTKPANQASEAIFRSGQPQKVDAVSYVIENGRKVEKPVDTSAPVSPVPIQAIETPEVEGKKKGGLFAFGKRGDATVEENEVVTPVPMPETFALAGPKPVVASPVASAPAQAKPVASPIPPATAVAAADTPAFEGIKKEKEEKSGWGPFRSKKKVEAPVAVPTAVTATPVVAVPVAATPATPSVPAGSTVKADPGVAATTTTFEVPRNEAKKDNDKKEDKGNHSGGILSPIANLRPPRKDIDFSSAETIIQNGEIVAGSNTTFDAAPMTNSAGPRQAPQVINGVKTYSSWSDVNARSSSAADRIIEKIR